MLQGPGVVFAATSRSEVVRKNYRRGEDGDWRVNVPRPPLTTAVARSTAVHRLNGIVSDNSFINVCLLHSRRSCLPISREDPLRHAEHSSKVDEGKRGKTLTLPHVDPASPVSLLGTNSTPIVVSESTSRSSEYFNIVVVRLLTGGRIQQPKATSHAIVKSIKSTLTDSSRHLARTRLGYCRRSRGS